MKWALVLSGGGARGLAHIGVIEALEKMHVPAPSMITGCSMGAIIGGLYASGMTPQEMREFLGTSFDSSKFMTNSPLSQKKGPIGKVVRFGKGVSNFFSDDGIDSGEKAHQMLLDLTKGIEFGQTRIPFYCNATDLCTGAEIVPDSGPIADAMRASSSFPGVFSPFERDGKLLVDGYLRHNTPVWIARRHGIRNTLAVYLNQFEAVEPGTIKTAINVLMRSFDCAVHSRNEGKLHIPTAHIMAKNDRSAFDFDRPDLQADFGYAATMEQKSTIDRFFSRGIQGMLNRRHLSIQEQKGAHT